MIYTELTKKALRLCFDAHKDQLDKSGMPYVFHPFHLAEQMDTEESVTVALLHDVIEDTDLSLEDLRQMGYPTAVINALALMTHEPDISYMDYVARISTNELATKVKLADLRHNSDLSRLDKVDEKAIARVEKYAKAIRLLENIHNTPEYVAKKKADAEGYKDNIRGCLIGGAAGDALGYPVEFYGVTDIYGDYGLHGITEYELDRHSGKALISDDTQMTLFTANGLLFGNTRGHLRGIAASHSSYIALAYKDWYMTQTTKFENKPTDPHFYTAYMSWLCDVPELYNRRAPGNTCLDALSDLKNVRRSDFIDPPLNNSKGCGGVMRVAPLALIQWRNMDDLIMEAARTAAVTHGHPLGYMTASVLCYIINRVVFLVDYPIDLKKIVIEAKEAVCERFKDNRYTGQLAEIIDRAIELTENDESDMTNIQLLGAGWVAEEALAIAIYCSLRYQHDFSSGIIAAVNHDGDSDSTGAITGNILGALVGYEAIDAKWKRDLEIADVILEMADDLCYGCVISEYEPYTDAIWKNKYLYARWKMHVDGSGPAH